MIVLSRWGTTLPAGEEDAMTRRILGRWVATGLALVLAGLVSADAEAAQDDDARAARPSTVDYVDGTVGMD
jgi:hypothetical protein